MLAAGQLRERVTLQRLVAGEDDIGQPLRQWEDLEADVPARVRPLRMREMVAAGSVVTESLIEVVVRYREDVTAGMRVLWRGVPYTVQGTPMDIEARREGVEIIASAGARAGDPA